jgi:hypothetical protein
MTKIQVPLPPYEVVFPEDNLEYIRNQRNKWYIAMGIHRAMTKNQEFYHCLRLQQYQPRNPQYYRQWYTPKLGPLPGEQS